MVEEARGLKEKMVVVVGRGLVGSIANGKRSVCFPPPPLRFLQAVI